jgi:hypothetical protein
MFELISRNKWSCQNSKEGPPDVGQSVLQAVGAQQLAVALCISCSDRPSGGCKYDGFFWPSQQTAVHFSSATFLSPSLSLLLLPLFLLTPPRPLFPGLALFAIVYLHPNSFTQGIWAFLAETFKMTSKISVCPYRQREVNEILDCPGGGYDIGVFWDMASCLLVSSNRRFRS